MDGAVAHAAARELVLALHAEAAVARACGQDDRARAVLAVLGPDGEVAVSVRLHGRDLGQVDFDAQVECVAEHLVAQLGAGDGGDAREIVHPRGLRNLSAEAVLLEYQHAPLGTAGVDSGGKAGGTSADDDDVVIRHIACSYPCYFGIAYKYISHSLHCRDEY